MAAAINTVFAGYDKVILAVLHFFSRFLGFILTPLAKLMTLLGEGGVIFFALAVVLACFSKTRKTAVCLFGSVCCGALITNIILKDLVARPRPFDAVPLFREWWMAVGAPAEDSFSFPSGHVTSAAAGMTALCRAKGKKYVKPTVIVVLVMMVCRNYLMVHYPSDTLFGAIIGVASAFIAWEITKLIYRFMEEYEDNPFCDFALHFDLPLPALAGIFDKLDKPEKAEAEKNVQANGREQKKKSGINSAELLRSLGIRRKKGKHQL